MERRILRVKYKGTICNRYSSTNHVDVDGEAGPPKYATSLTAQITQPHLQNYNRATVQLLFCFKCTGFFISLWRWRRFQWKILHGWFKFKPGPHSI